MYGGIRRASLTSDGTLDQPLRFRSAIACSSVADEVNVRSIGVSQNFGEMGQH